MASGVVIKNSSIRSRRVQAVRMPSPCARNADRGSGQGGLMKISNRTAVIVAERGGLSLPPPSLFASDSRLKEAVVPLKQLANGVELYRFRYKGDSKVYVGVIAQQVARLMPRAVLR